MSIPDTLSFQLYSARNFPPLDAQLAMLARLGYRHVEPFGALYADLEGLAAALARHGLSAPSAHVDLGLLENDPERALAIARRLGVSLVVAPYLTAENRPTDAAGWRALGERLSRIRGRLAESGMRLAWHNHDFEMRALPDGSVPIDLILAADPMLQWEVDVGWIARAQADPVAWLDRHAGRIGAVHVKDVARNGEAADEDGWADPGAGVLDWSRIIPAALKGGAGLFVVEHDNPRDVERCAAAAMVAARSWAQ